MTDIELKALKDNLRVPRLQKIKIIMNSATMKKLLTIALLLVGLTASAQGTWTTGVNKGDELKGTQDYNYYLYEVKGMGSIAVWDSEDWTFKLTSYNGQFTTWRVIGSAATVYYVDILIGIYDSTGKLIEKFNDEIEADVSQNSKYAYVNDRWPYRARQKRRFKRAVQAMKNGEGYVRIVCQRRGKPDFDMTITPYNKQ